MPVLSREFLLFFGNFTNFQKLFSVDTVFPDCYNQTEAAEKTVRCGLYFRMYPFTGKDVLTMYKITLQIDDMMCRMCEAHVNKALTEAFAVKEVTSSHEKHSTEILTGQQLDEQAVREAVSAAGYTVERFAQEAC